MAAAAHAARRRRFGFAQGERAKSSPSPARACGLPWRDQLCYERQWQWTRRDRSCCQYKQQPPRRVRAAAAAVAAAPIGETSDPSVATRAWRCSGWRKRRRASGLGEVADSTAAETHATPLPRPRGWVWRRLTAVGRSAGVDVTVRQR
eukprot:351082-Chlamydomonas_euryale.AAC.7